MIERSQFIRIANNGIFKGALLRPVLFLIFINDLERVPMLILRQNFGKLIHRLNLFDDSFPLSFFLEYLYINRLTKMFNKNRFLSYDKFSRSRFYFFIDEPTTYLSVIHLSSNKFIPRFLQIIEPLQHNLRKLSPSNSHNNRRSFISIR